MSSFRWSPPFSNGAPREQVSYSTPHPERTWGTTLKQPEDGRRRPRPPAWGGRGPRQSGPRASRRHGGFETQTAEGIPARGDHGD